MGSFISFVPTPYEDIEPIFLLAPVSAADVVYDLGCGDGRLLFAALEKGAGRAVGVELDPTPLQRARMKAKELELEDRITFLEADVMEVDLSPATLVLCYLITAASAALKQRFETVLRPGTRVVMEAFPIHGWKPIETWEVPYKTFYLYRMPPEIESSPQQRSRGYEYFNFNEGF